MRIKPVKTEGDYEAALATLVQTYEAKHHPVGPPDPVAPIEYEMEKRGLTRQDLERVIGPSGRVSEVLSRRRHLTLAMMRRLQGSFGLRADVLLADYPLAESAPARQPPQASPQQAPAGA